MTIGDDVSDTRLAAPPGSQKAHNRMTPPTRRLPEADGAAGQLSRHITDPVRFELVARLALLDSGGTLVDRESASNNAMTGLRRTHGFAPDTERWLLAELTDRAYPNDLVGRRRHRHPFHSHWGLTNCPQAESPS
ncbi:hypothetical protein [Streptomyces sp. NPDC047071]|uniref:hypothetical protein n=1 Tax=Streptomyces sp. NPDC047071 TaxID=3154808 RepID=UPI003455EFB2